MHVRRENTIDVRGGVRPHPRTYLGRIVGVRYLELVREDEWKEGQEPSRQQDAAGVRRGHDRCGLRVTSNRPPPCSTTTTFSIP